MAIAQDHLYDIMKSAFPDAEIKIDDLLGDQDHYKITVTSEAFRNKSKVMQHQLVYKALQGKMGNELHALSITTLVP